MVRSRAQENRPRFRPYGLTAVRSCSIAAPSTSVRAAPFLAPSAMLARRHCCIEPSRDTSAARSSPELRQRAADRAHRAALVAKMGDLGPDASVAQEDFPSRDHLNAQCNSAIRSSPSLVTPTVVAGPSRRTVTAESETQGQSWNGLAPKIATGARTTHAGVHPTKPLVAYAITP